MAMSIKNIVVGYDVKNVISKGFDWRQGRRGLGDIHDNLIIRPHEFFH